MLIVIFILLMIVFFPILSLLFGVTFMAALIQFWWVFLILFGLLSFCAYVDRKEKEEADEARIQRAVTAALLATKEQK